ALEPAVSHSAVHLVEFRCASGAITRGQRTDDVDKANFPVWCRRRSATTAARACAPLVQEKRDSCRVVGIATPAGTQRALPVFFTSLDAYPWKLCISSPPVSNSANVLFAGLG